jgi:hypothetical protein
MFIFTKYQTRMKMKIQIWCLHKHFFFCLLDNYYFYSSIWRELIDIKNYKKNCLLCQMICIWLFEWAIIMQCTCRYVLKQRQIKLVEMGPVAPTRLSLGTWTLRIVSSKKINATTNPISDSYEENINILLDDFLHHIAQYLPFLNSIW